MHNWAGNVHFSTTDVREPATLGELAEVVRSSRRVRVLGSGHSFSTVGDTDGTLVSLRGLVAPPVIDHERAVAVVAAGATYAEVGDALHAQGWALRNLGSLPHISIGGACATGTHGSGAALGCLASEAVAVELLLADGELVRFGRDDPDFPGMVLSLGSLGVVTRLWLGLVPAYEIAQEVQLSLPVESVVDHAEEILGSDYSVSIFSAFGTPATIDAVWFKQRVPLRHSGPDRAARWGGRPATEEVHPILGLDPAPTTGQLGRPGPWHRRLPHFRIEFTPSAGDELQSEFFLPRAYAGAAIAALTEIAGVLRGVLQVFEMRTVAADGLWLSPFHQRDTVAVHATWISDLERVRPALTALERALAPFDPRPHWGKVHLGWDAERIAGTYPELPRFRELADRLDPERRFVNEYVERLGVR